MVPLGDFGKQKSSPDGLRYECKLCQAAYMTEWRAANRQRMRDHQRRRWEGMSTEEKARKNALDAARYARDKRPHRESYLRRYYGISVEQYEEMAAAQNGQCVICGGTEEKRLLSVDHDHACCPGIKSCGKCLRGLLCSNCNHGLGNFQDNTALLLRAVAYLSKE